MHTYMCTCIFWITHTHTHTYTYLCTYKLLFWRMQMVESPESWVVCIYIYIYVYTRIFTHLYTYTNTYIHTHIRTNRYDWACRWWSLRNREAYIYIYIYIYMYIYTYMRVYVCMFVYMHNNNNTHTHTSTHARARAHTNSYEWACRWWSLRDREAYMFHPFDQVRGTQFRVTRRHALSSGETHKTLYMCHIYSNTVMCQTTDMTCTYTCNTACTYKCNTACTYKCTVSKATSYGHKPSQYQAYMRASHPRSFQRLWNILLYFFNFSLYSVFESWSTMCWYGYGFAACLLPGMQRDFGLPPNVQLSILLLW
jgi:hypothetical protein